MNKTSELKFIELSDLKLDINNPRFGELYGGSTDEDELIKYLLQEEAAEEIANAISSKKEFYEDKALWVIKDHSDGKFVVRDGNRRCSAVKALQDPQKYNISLPKFEINVLPVYEYTDESELSSRIGEEHAASLFRNWERVPKALYIISLLQDGKKDEIDNLEPRPGDFIKLGSFYKEAVKYGGEDLKQQVRRGRGKLGGKTIIYERLFRDAKDCGYKFRNSPNFNIEISNNNKFKAYIKALVKYIKKNPDIKTSIVDNDKAFIDKLIEYGFDKSSSYHPNSGHPNSGHPNSGHPNSGHPNSGHPNSAHPNSAHPNSAHPNSAQPNSAQPNSGQPDSGQANLGQPINKRGSVKKNPEIKRKKLPQGLKSRIDEYFKIDSKIYPNAKIAMARVTYECVLKYIVDNTKCNNILLKNSGHFGSAYVRRPYTNFDELNKKFIELITDIGINNAFKMFEFDKMHQIVHNYIVSSKTLDADQINSNLIPLLEFLLQDVEDLKLSLDISKIK